MYLLRVPGKKEENQNDQNSQQTKKSLFKSLLGFNFLQRNLSPEIRKYSLYQKYFKIWPELRIGREQFAIRFIWLLLFWLTIFSLGLSDWFTYLSRLHDSGISFMFWMLIVCLLIGLTFYATFYKRCRDFSLSNSMNFKALYWIFVFIQPWIMGVYAYVALLLLVFVYFGSRLGQALNNKNGPDPSSDKV